MPIYIFGRLLFLIAITLNYLSFSNFSNTPYFACNPYVHSLLLFNSLTLSTLHSTSFNWITWLLPWPIRGKAGTETTQYLTVMIFLYLTYIFSGYRHMSSTVANSSSEESQETLHHKERHHDGIKSQNIRRGNIIQRHKCHFGDSPWISMMKDILTLLSFPSFLPTVSYK